LVPRVCRWSAHALGARSQGEAGEDAERAQQRDVLVRDERSEAGRHEQRGEGIVHLGQ